METQLIRIKDLKNNTGQINGLPKNPRILKNDKFIKLKKSLQDDPEMLELREVIAYDNNGELVVICGNMRLKALKELGIKEVPIKILPIETSVEKLKAYIIKDNVSFGEHSWDDLANEWDEEKLDEWGLDIPLGKEFGDDKEEGEVEFSEFIDEEHNYVVLYFDNRIDWLQAETHFDLKSVTSKRSNGKAWSTGVGRVINGTSYLKGLKK